MGIKKNGHSKAVKVSSTADVIPPKEPVDETRPMGAAGTTRPRKNRPQPNWFPNLLFLMLTVTVVRGLIHHNWPDVDLGLDVTRELFSYVDEAELSVVLAVVFTLTILYRRHKSRNVAPPPAVFNPHESRTAHLEVANPLMSLTPIPEDKERFQRVIEDEWKEIANARVDRGHLVTERIRGMCFSGGGIRAASYMAGAMEVLEETRLLPLCDYLSTVSGGGYTGSAFMTRDREANKTVSRLVRRMTVNSDYLGVSSNEVTNTVATMDFALSVTAALANNGISVLAYSIVAAEYTDFMLKLQFGDSFREKLTNFLMGWEGEMPSISDIQNSVLIYLAVVVLGVSMFWIIVYGLYSATESTAGSVRENLTTTATKRAKRFVRRKTRVSLGLHRSDSWDPSSILDIDTGGPMFPRSHTECSFDKQPESDEDVVSDDDIEDNAAAAKPEDLRERRIQVNHFLSYLMRCLIVVLAAIATFIALLYIMKYLLVLRQNSQNTSNQIFLSVEMTAALTFGLSRGFAGSDSTQSTSSKIFILVLVGISGVVAVLFIIARIMLWRILGCGFMTCDPPDTCSTIVGCGCEPSQHVLLGIFIYVLVVEVFIREPLGQALHDMYRRRLVGSFYKNGKDKLFKDIPRRPYFICNAALNNMQDPVTGNRTTHPFFLSKKFCGSPLTGYRSTEELGTYLSKGMAISGAALSTQFDTFLTAPVKMAMMLMGIDLGEWFRFRRNSPFRHYTVQLLASLPFILLIFASQIVPPTPSTLAEPQIYLYGLSLVLFLTPVFLMITWGLLLQLLNLNKSNVFLHFPLYRKMYQFFGFLSWKRDPYFYLADGGWFDFYGLYELLRRGVEEIFLFDADADHTNFSDLLDSLSRAESDLGVKVDLSYAEEGLTEVMKSKRTHTKDKQGLGLVDRNVLHIRVQYPVTDADPVPRMCDIWIGKLSLTGGEPPWVKLYALSDSSFPHHSVSNQNFDTRTFRAYRELGRYVADSMIKARNEYTVSKTSVGQRTPCRLETPSPL